MKKENNGEDLLKKLDLVVDKMNKIEERLDSILKFIEQFSKPTGVVTKVNDKQIKFTQGTEGSKIMEKFNEWMLRKDPKNDMSVFDVAEGDQDNF